MLDQNFRDHRVNSRIIRAGLRTLQVAFALAVVILYAIDLKTATMQHAQADSSWIFAEVVAGLSIITCGLYSYLTIKHVLWCIWNGVLFILWATTLGRFASLYLSIANESLNGPSTSSVPRMKAAIWIDLVNMLLWVVDLTATIVCCCATTRKVSKKSGKILVNGGDEECGELAAEADVPAVRAMSRPVSSASLQKAMRYEDDEGYGDNIAWDSASTRPPSYISELEVIEEDSVAEWKS